ncbi:MAG: sigma-70 family RNA polymerase sigma factor [Nitrospirae bacterium]|nr:sigma-70 family RNA polymerase sigma factor [Nitrospirota bacterium]
MTDSSHDTELIARCLSDENGMGWEAFVRTYSKLIWNSIHKTFSSYNFRYSQEDTEDIYSSVFLSLIENNFKKLKQFKGENACSLATWLTIITSRLTIDYMRKDKRHLFVEPHSEEKDILDLIPDGRDCAEKTLEGKQINEGFKKSVNSLSPQDKMLYDMLYHRGISSEEAAEILGISVAVVYTKKHRIIKKIKKNVKKV